MPVTNLPIDFVAIRASSIPYLLQDERTNLKAGITGSDILWEAGMGKRAGDELPIAEIFPNSKKSSLFVGITKDFDEFAFARLCAFDLPNTRHLQGRRVATKYPRIAEEVFRERQMKDVNIMPVAGTDEAMQYIMHCEGILGIISSGNTVAANDIVVLERFYDVTVQMVQATDKLTNQDVRVLDELKNRIALAIQIRKPLTTLYM